MAGKIAEKVTHIMNKPVNIRNIAICAHIDHGKTTFSDNLLCGAGMMSEELAGKACQLDFHEDEKTRGITIDAANVNMVHTFKGEEYLINLIDTPGHVDFGGDVTRAMRAVDGAIVLCCASEGIMPQTETVLRQALREKVKPVLFINKVDRLIKELQLTPEKMQERFIKIIGEVNKLIKIIAPDAPPEWQVQVQDGSVAFGSAFHNWAISMPYMKENNITFKDIIDAYQSSDTEAYKTLAKKAPIHQVVLNMVVRHLPNPIQAAPYRIPHIWPGDTETEEGKQLIACDPNGQIFFVITKIEIDPQAGEISTGRLFSGTLIKGTEIYLNRAKQQSKIQQVFIRNGAKREIVDNVPAGNIVSIAGVKSFAGETITQKETEPFREITHIFAPVITKSIDAVRPSELPRLVEVLRQVQKEDPSIVVTINDETGENLISGMGELHLEIIENRIKSEKHMDVKTSPPVVIYRETITKESPEVEGKTPNKHNKFFFKVAAMSEEMAKAIKEGRIQEGRIKKKDMELRDVLVSLGMDSKKALKIKDVYKGNILFEETKGQIHLIEVMEMVCDMFEDVMENGPLAREPSIRVVVTLTDIKLHEDAIHRGPAQVYPAVREGIRGAMMNARPMLFEPLQTIQIEAPEEFMGAVSALISNKRGQLLDMQQESGLIIVKAKLPVGEMIGWSSDLRSATGGRGSSSLIDQNYEKLPEELQQKIVKQIKDRKGLTDAQVGV